PLVFAFGEDTLLVFFVEFVFDIADDLFEHILHGDQARYSAVFIDDDGQVVVTRAEFAQQHVQTLGLGNKDRRTDQGAQLDVRIQHAAQQVCGQQNPDDVVAVVFVDRKARVRRIDDEDQQFRQRQGDT